MRRSDPLWCCRTQGAASLSLWTCRACLCT
uniref:Uncharacterized protein n=1 Tax=Rhizophora mucronata TaxID=61149 RepID=A0A2P2PZ10_RHIMU